MSTGLEGTNRAQIVMRFQGFPATDLPSLVSRQKIEDSEQGAALSSDDCPTPSSHTSSAQLDAESGDFVDLGPSRSAEPWPFKSDMFNQPMTGPPCDPASPLCPPIIQHPLFDNTDSMAISGILPGTTLKVFVNGTEQVYNQKIWLGFASVVVTRRLKVGEIISATQTINGMTSPPTLHPREVRPISESALATTKPWIQQPYECATFVGVQNLMPSARVYLRTSQNQWIGWSSFARRAASVSVPALRAGMELNAQEWLLEGRPKEGSGIMSNTVTVRPRPNPLPAPTFENSSLCFGNTVLLLGDLIGGATIYVMQDGQNLSSGQVAPLRRCWVFLSRPLSQSSVSVHQIICGQSSYSRQGVPEKIPPTPELLGPVCPGSNYVLVRKGIINAYIDVFRNGSIVASSGAFPTDTAIALGSRETFQVGDVVEAIQRFGFENGPTHSVSAPSKFIKVANTNEPPVVEITGGEPFFVSTNSNEQAIDGPVFPRGRGSGPSIRVSACCSNVSLKIMDPAGKVVAEPRLEEIVPGHYKATWAWRSNSNWKVPDGVPVGRYSAVARSNCGSSETKKLFYVIFDPGNVGGPEAFSFNSVAVWFGNGENRTFADRYYLRQSDMRVFSKAIEAINGLTDSYEAAGAIARAEDKLFGYDLIWHTRDVLDMINNYKTAQCADDACICVSFMRCAGIPAHPVTADSFNEYYTFDKKGPAHWGFDTWLEVLVPLEGKIQWGVIHNHWTSPAQSVYDPVNRKWMGKHKNVAGKRDNDIVIMANEKWIDSNVGDNIPDVGFRRLECGRPAKDLVFKADWVDELCELYWESPHWQCGSTSSATCPNPSAHNADTPQFKYSTKPNFGGRIRGTIEVDARNRMIADSLSEDWSLILYKTNIFEMKVFGDEIVHTSVLPKKGTGTTRYNVDFDFPAPDTLSEVEQLALRCVSIPRSATGLPREKYHVMDIKEHVLAEDTIDIASEIKIEPASNISLLSLEMHQSQAISTTVTNIGSKTLNEVVVTIRHPFALRCEPEHYRLAILEAGKSQSLDFTLVAAASMDFGGVDVVVTTENGGAASQPHQFKVARNQIVDIESEACSAIAMW
ncbi:uncharacterized protein KY384_002442 [Bacidia gigantensis]|uniref:uncharacterized protein n=1 Tax=Bacidia gigantensis TaxID=2732470 RepID=UPI001D046802|nr:uncharacterized protein KY384_002442 [Bacidia gigantensis]KAG8532565.1 hypothetical protein KY384_002442 [Bacidia gigantensis]